LHSYQEFFFYTNIGEANPLLFKYITLFSLLLCRLTGCLLAPA